MAIYTPKDIGGFGRLADVGFKKRAEAREERRLSLAERSQGLSDELKGLQIKQTKSNLEQAMKTSKIKAGLSESMKNIPEGENQFTHGYKYLMGQGEADLASKYMKSQSARVEQIYKMDPEKGIEVFNDTIGKTMGTTLEYHKKDKKYGDVFKAVDNKSGKEVYLQKTDQGFEMVEGYTPISTKATRTKAAVDLKLEDDLTSQFAIDKNLNEVQARLEAKKEIAAAKKVKDSSGKEKTSKQFETATKLRKEYTTLSKDFMKVRDAYGRVQAASVDPSAAGDLALIFNYMKILDPGSVVRESEFATAANAAGVPDRVRNTFNKVLSGERLAKNQRQDFVSRAGALFGSANNQHDKRKDTFTKLSNMNDINPEEVVIDIGLAEGLGEGEKIFNVDGSKLKAKKGKDGNYYYQIGDKFYRVNK